MILKIIIKLFMRYATLVLDKEVRKKTPFSRLLLLLLFVIV